MREQINDLMRRGMGDTNWCPMDGDCCRTDDHCWECFTEKIVSIVREYVEGIPTFTHAEQAIKDSMLERVG